MVLPLMRVETPLSGCTGRPTGNLSGGNLNQLCVAPAPCVPLWTRGAARNHAPLFCGDCLVLSPLHWGMPSRETVLGQDCYLVDSASSHMLVSKIKPCMSKYKQLYRETANGSLNQLSFI
jgi:hypothetical protein